MNYKVEAALYLYFSVDAVTGPNVPCELRLVMSYDSDKQCILYAYNIIGVLYFITKNTNFDFLMIIYQLS